MDDKIIFTPDTIIGRTFYIPEEKTVNGQNMGPLVAELTGNGILFLKSLNQSSESIRVGYMLLGNNKLHRHESSYGYTPAPKGNRNKKGSYGWTNYEPGCYPTVANFGDLAICAVEVKVFDLNEYDGEPIRKFAYKPPAPPKSVISQVTGKAPPPPGEVEEGWVLI